MISGIANSAYARTADMYNSISLPNINLKSVTRNISSIAIPVIAMVAIANLPTADAWWGSNGPAYIECMDKCDRVADDAMKMLCYALCWIVT